ncbi:hypothetical protein C8R45DRAFT_969473 [Mycena sanguinolenta]|nr:hypothetical protein C8R45DRAFT_969473 [Mycena sanguinolenta]
MHFNTILTRSPASLLRKLSRDSGFFATKDHILLFALSPGNASSSELAELVQNITSISPRSIGCLSGPLDAHDDGILACSFALFKPNTCFPFRSEIPGRASPQVGRKHSFRHKGSQIDVLDQDLPSGKIDWGAVWDQNSTNIKLPTGLDSLNPDDIGTVIYFTDAAPEGLTNALARFPGATKLGLFAAPTPFTTGRPVTLFQGDKIYGTGAVGLALRHPKPHAQVIFYGMEPLCPPMLVSQAEGNLVISLDNKNPTQLLLSAIRAAGIDPRSEKFGLFEDSNEFALATLREEKPHQMFSIMSGDPSRGTIALRSMSAPPVGSRVQFFHSPNPKTSPWEGKRNPKQKRLQFTASSSTGGTQFVGLTNDDVCVHEDEFTVASEEGFILSRSEEGKSEAPWTSTIPGSVGALSWTPEDA